MSSNTVGDVTGGDFYCSGGTFWANNAGQRGVIDLGDIGATALDLVEIPAAGYTRFGVAAALNHTYVSLAQEGEEGSYVVFRVTSLNAATNEVVISYLYRTPLLIDFNHFCLEHPLLCGHLKLPCAKYPQLCERQIVIPVEDGIRIKFFGEEKRVVVPVDGICRYVLNCPGCEFSALCPGYNISFTDMPQPFGVEIYTASGVLVASDMTGSTAKAIEFEANRGEELFLVLSPTRETKAGVEYSVHLKVRPIGR